MSNFIISKQQYLKIKNSFKQHALQKRITTADLIFYNYLRCKQLNHGFTPISNPRKLAAGMHKWLGLRAGLDNLLFTLRYQIKDRRCLPRTTFQYENKNLDKPFEIILTEEQFKQAIDQVVKAYQLY